MMIETKSLNTFANVEAMALMTLVMYMLLNLMIGHSHLSVLNLAIR